MVHQSTQHPNVISEIYQKYVVEFSITVVDPTYSELLRDPEDPQYSDVTQKLTDKVRLKSFYSPELFFFLIILIKA